MERADQFRWTARTKATSYGGDSRPPPENVYPDSYRPPPEFYYSPQSDPRRPRQLHPHHQSQLQPGTPTPPATMSDRYSPEPYGMPPDPSYKRDRHGPHGGGWQPGSFPAGARSPQPQPPQQSQQQQDPRYGFEEGMGHEDEDGW